MRVCLVSAPTAPDFEDTVLSDAEYLQSSLQDVPLGILTLAAVLERDGFAVQLLDLDRMYIDHLAANRVGWTLFSFYEDVLRCLSEVDCEFFGFSSICSSYPLTLRLATALKKQRPDVHVLLGGPQASVVDVPTLKAFPNVDVIVRGEAEETLPRVLEAFSGRAQLDFIHGITFYAGGTIHRTPNAPPIDDLDTLPMPAFHLYGSILKSANAPLELGRGCPFACKFCSTNDFFRRRYRLKSPAKVLEQMIWMEAHYGTRQFELMHDMFTVDRKRVVAFCETLLASGKKYEWGCSARTDYVDPELIEQLWAAGCRLVFFGIETGSAQLQRVVDKNLDLSEAMAMVETSAKRGLKTTVSTITGFPEETQPDFACTVDFVMQAARFDEVETQIHLFEPLAETPMSTQYRRELVFDDIFSDLSHQGWKQDLHDRAAIMAYPDVFSNFYAPPTPFLDRAYLQEARIFIGYGLVRYRWLLVALHQETANLLSVFDDWTGWIPNQRASTYSEYRRGTLYQYYRSPEFGCDLIKYVRTRYLAELSPASISVPALLGFYDALTRAARHDVPSRCGQVDSEDIIHLERIPVLAADVDIVDVDYDIAALLDCLRERRPPVDIAGKHCTLVTRGRDRSRLEFLKVTPASARLLRLCDGVRTIRQIAGLFQTTAEWSFGSLSSEDLCLRAFALLRKDRLVGFD
jgi:radical SAM superfamily enzyme YgiQ (UPF0313 family)